MHRALARTAIGSILIDPQDLCESPDTGCGSSSIISMALASRSSGGTLENLLREPRTGEKLKGVDAKHRRQDKERRSARRWLSCA